VIKGVDIDIDDGEFVVFVGPSGCGKSTLLRMIAGLEDITSGTLEIDGDIVNAKPPKDRGIAMVFQTYAIFPHMTVRENVAFGLTINGVPKAEKEAKVAEAARVLQMEHLMDRKPTQLSGGQRQRVAIGRAIVRDPKVFLFDEPLSNLDAALRMDMRMEIGKLHKDLAASMIYVTHDQVEAMTLADKIVVMSRFPMRPITHCGYRCVRLRQSLRDRTSPSASGPSTSLERPEVPASRSGSRSWRISAASPLPTARPMRVRT
jgi:multiple sugar transport system ATP-binding protein